MKTQWEWEKERRANQQAFYDSMHTEQVKLKLNRDTDADILAWIAEKRYSRNESIQGAIKALIRADIAAHRESV